MNIQLACQWHVGDVSPAITDDSHWTVCSSILTFTAQQNFHSLVYSFQFTQSESLSISTYICFKNYGEYICPMAAQCFTQGSNSTFQIHTGRLLSYTPALLSQSKVGLYTHFYSITLGIRQDFWSLDKIKVFLNVIMYKNLWEIKRSIKCNTM